MEITIYTDKSDEKAKKFVIELREPQFEEYSGALMALQAPSGALDKLKAGRFIIETCCVSGLEELEKDQKAYVTACLDVYNEVLNIYESEVKKN